MDGYIKKQDLMDYTDNQTSKRISNNEIARFPVANVAEVVKCEHCKHLMTDVSVEYTPYGFENDIREYGCKRIFDLTGEWVDVMLDDFCSYGERRDGEE